MYQIFKESPTHSAGAGPVTMLTDEHPTRPSLNQRRLLGWVPLKSFRASADRPMLSSTQPITVIEAVKPAKGLLAMSALSLARVR
jgi:hypothetical protein